MKDAARYKILHRRRFPVDAHIEIEDFFPHGDEEAELTLLSRVFLRDLQLDGFVGAVQAGKERRRRFTHLEIDWAILDLNDDVVVERAVKRMEVIVGSLGAIIFQIVPIEVMVVHERAIKHDAAMRLESASNHIPGISGRSAVGGRTQSPFGVGFDHEATEIRYLAVDFVDLFSPPVGDAWIERVKCVEASHHLWTAQVDRHRKLYTPRTENVCDAADLGNEVVFKNAGSCIDIIDRASVNSDRSEKASILPGSSEIFADFSVGKEDGGSAVATLNAAIKVVPLVNPANGSIGLLHFVELRKALAASDLTQEGKRTIEDAAIRRASDDKAL